MKLNKEDIQKELEAHKDNLKHYLKAAEVTKIAIKAFEEELKKFPEENNSEQKL